MRFFIFFMWVIALIACKAHVKTDSPEAFKTFYTAHGIYNDTTHKIFWTSLYKVENGVKFGYSAKKDTLHVIYGRTTEDDIFVVKAVEDSDRKFIKERIEDFELINVYGRKDAGGFDFIVYQNREEEVMMQLHNTIGSFMSATYFSKSKKDSLEKLTDKYDFINKVNK